MTTTRKSFWDFGDDADLPELVSADDRARQQAARDRYTARHGSLEGFALDLDTYDEDGTED